MDAISHLDLMIRYVGDASAHAASEISTGHQAGDDHP